MLCQDNFFKYFGENWKTGDRSTHIHIKSGLLEYRFDCVCLETLRDYASCERGIYNHSNDRDTLSINLTKAESIQVGGKTFR